MHRFIPVLFLCFSTGVAQGKDSTSTCETSYAVTKLAGALGGAEASFSQLDVSGFSNSIEETILFVLPCLKEPVDSVVAARVHRMLALRAYSSRREELINPSLLAGRQLQPDYKWPDDLIPEGHEFRDRYEALPVLAAESRKLRAPSEGSLWVDGEQTLEMVMGRASIVQYINSEGETDWTQYRMPSDDLRSYPVIPRTRYRLLVASGVQLAVAGALLGGSIAAKDAFDDQSTERSLEDIDRLRTSANTLRSASLGLGASGGACLGLSLAFWNI